MKQIINEDMWSEEDQFYWDIDKDGSFMKVKTIASFWPMWGRVTDEKHVKGLVKHLNDSDSFNRPHRVPTTAADQEEYVPTGGYWRGSIWAPTNHMIVKGLEANGRQKLARDIVLNHLNNQAAVFQGTDTVWENYAPEFTKPGSPAKPDFVGWSADGPIAQLIENYIGINENVPENKIRWNLLTTEEVGLKNLEFGDSTVKLIAKSRDKMDDDITIEVDTQHAFDLELYDGESTYQRKVTPSDKQLTIEV
jgi:glycogen debranching enzyme